MWEHALGARESVSPIPLSWVRSHQGAGAGCELANLGPHALTCEPGGSKGDANAIRHAVVDAAAGVAGVSPTRAVAENLAGAGENALQYLPDTHWLKQSA